MHPARTATRLPFYWAARRFDRASPLPISMSFVVTDRCNSLCKTCNIGKRYLDDPSIADDELTIAEYERVFETMGSPAWVTLSGGEPFMRRDFADLTVALLRRTRPRVINVPTNGTFVHATGKVLDRVVPELGETRLIVNFSVDGVGPAHDELRGFENNSALLLDCVRAVRDRGDPRVLIGVNTTLSRFNAHAAEEILEWVQARIAPDSHVVEVAQIRPEYHNEGARLLGDDLEPLRRALNGVQRRVKRERRRGVARIIKAFRLSYYARVEEGLSRPRPHRCYAGYSTCTVMASGEVWSNTQRADRMGHVRDHGCDFGALWRSPAAAAARRRVRADDCVCESSNASYTNALMDPRTMAGVAYNLVRWP